jgi:acyl-CoA reductase-like NAD-dependent aldehyde dehydrogenase
MMNSSKESWRRVKELRMGVEIGPLTTPRQLEIVERHVRDAVEKGAQILIGGKRREGLFFEPTVLVKR